LFVSRLLPSIVYRLSSILYLFSSSVFHRLSSSLDLPLLSCWERRPNQIKLSVQASPLWATSLNLLWKEVWRIKDPMKLQICHQSSGVWEGDDDEWRSRGLATWVVNVLVLSGWELRVKVEDHKLFAPRAYLELVVMRFQLFGACQAMLCFWEGNMGRPHTIRAGGGNSVLPNIIIPA
jgi:hypothetical protein